MASHPKVGKQIRMEKEKDVKARVKKLLDDHGWFWWMPPMNGFGTVGVSDFNAIRKGVFLAVETKFGSNKPTANQLAYLNSINAEDAFGFVVNEKTLEQFAGWLDAFDRACTATGKGTKVTSDDGAYMLDAIKAMTEMLA